MPTAAALFFVVTAADDPWLALGLLLGNGDAQDSHVPVAAIALVITGWLMIPATVGALAGIAIEQQIERSRRVSPDEIKRAVLAQILKDAPGGPVDSGPKSADANPDDGCADPTGER